MLCPSLIAQFLEMSIDSALRPRLRSVARHLADLADSGHVVENGDEARVPVHSFALQGPAFKELRSAPPHGARGRSFLVSCRRRCVASFGAPDSPTSAREKHASERDSLSATSRRLLCRFRGALEHYGRMRRPRTGGPSFPGRFSNLLTPASALRPGRWTASQLDALARDQLRVFNLGWRRSRVCPRLPAPPWRRFDSSLPARRAFYNFRGLARQREFNPVWERVTGYPGWLTLPRALTTSWADRRWLQRIFRLATVARRSALMLATSRCWRSRLR